MGDCPSKPPSSTSAGKHLTSPKLLHPDPFQKNLLKKSVCRIRAGKRSVRWRLAALPAFIPLPGQARNVRGGDHPGRICLSSPWVSSFLGVSEGGERNACPAIFSWLLQPPGGSMVFIGRAFGCPSYSFPSMILTVVQTPARRSFSSRHRAALFRLPFIVCSFMPALFKKTASFSSTLSCSPSF